MENVNPCWYCQGQLVWDADFDYTDVFPWEEGSEDKETNGIVTMLHCSQCGASVQYVLKDEEEGDD